MTSSSDNELCFLCSKSKTFQEFTFYSNQLFSCTNADCGDYKISKEGMMSIMNTCSRGAAIKPYLKRQAKRARIGKCIASIGEKIDNRINTIYI